MFGREYANHPEILTHSFGQINKQYQKKILTNTNNSFLLEKLKKIYVLVFGIPEIGFQLRSLYFKQVMTKHILHRKFSAILDAGSGIGLYTFSLGKMFYGANVTGVDIDTYKLKSCKRLAKEFGTKNVVFDYLDLTNIRSKETYDLIVCIDVIEHIENYKLVFKNFYKLLRKGGFVYIHVPQPNQKRILPMLRNWHHDDHAHEGISRSALETMLKKFGFNIIVSRETFGFFGKLAWELNHMTLSKSFLIAGLIYPILYIVAKMDFCFDNKNGLGIAILAKKTSIKSHL